MANVKGTGSTTRGKSQKGTAGGLSGGQSGSPGRGTKDPGRMRGGSPPVHSLPMTGATNMQKGSDNMAHHPNGDHKATNPGPGQRC